MNVEMMNLLTTMFETDNVDVMSKRLYKGTEAGLWLRVGEDCVHIGSIVEGSDVEFHEKLSWPFSAKEFFDVADHINEEACMEWELANEVELVV